MGSHVEDLEVVVRLQATVRVSNQAAVRDGAARIRIAGSAAGEAQLVRGGEQYALQLAGPHRRMALRIEGGDAAHDWGCDRGAAEPDVLAADDKAWVREREGTTRRQGSDDAAARGDEIRL